MVTTNGFEGFERMVSVLDQAVQQPTVEALTSELKDRLSELIREGSIRLPADLSSPCGNHYARRLLHRSEDYGYVVVAMIWGPGQGTPLHDHDGTWCVEGVLAGDIEVTQYDLVDENGSEWRFERKDTHRTGVGTAGSLIPPFEYHTIANASDEKVSITLHVYGHEMNTCTIFEPVADDCFTKRTKALGYDA
ncbi:MAG: cysteine dioxygenase family protein [Deltaproteobacteria bacterium]|nr:cysteine dioxygenase family protein [Deltaproteobacteria bacterium]